MKKKLLVSVLAVSILGTSTVFAAENHFSSVPKDHWAYNAVEKLVQDGLIDGYGDQDFRGEKSITRYEMAQLVAKAMSNMEKADAEDKAAIDKLENEYASELKAMDIRLSKVENGMSSFKWFGDARIRYSNNLTGSRVSNTVSSINGNTVNASYSGSEKKKTETRLRLGFYGEPAENLSVLGQLKAEDTNNKADDSTTSWSSTHNAVTINRLELDWHAKNGFTLATGRMQKNLGQGLIWWENPIDGFSVEKNFNDKGSLMVGVGDLSPENWSNTTEYAFFANAKAKISPAVEITAAYMNAHSDNVITHNYIADWNPWYGWKNGNSSGADYNATKYDLGLFSLGMNAQLSNKWSIIAEGVHNSKGDREAENSYTGNNAHKNGFWTRLIYGKQNWGKANTWQTYFEYMALGGSSIDSSGWGHRLNIAGGNGYGGDGTRGWGLGVSYMLASNTNLELTYYKLKPYDKADAGFDNYESTAYAALSFSF